VRAIAKEDTKFNVPFGFHVVIKPYMGDGGFGIALRST
jgi:glutathione synthase/RimK-type ligase-like ATP-grasp enzyme